MPLLPKLVSLEASYTKLTNQGIAKLKDIKPELIVLDLEMPGMNGVETLMKIKGDPATKDERVIFLTNYGEPQEKLAEVDKKFASEVGALCYLRKTDDMTHIVKEIQQHATTPSYTHS